MGGGQSGACNMPPHVDSGQDIYLDKKCAAIV